MNKALRVFSTVQGDGASVSFDLDFSKDPFWYDEQGLVAGGFSTSVPTKLHNFPERGAFASALVGVANVVVSGFGLVSAVLTGSILTVTVNVAPAAGQLVNVTAVLLF